MNGHAGIDTLEATEHLKNILNVGKTEIESGKLKPSPNDNMESSGDSNLVLDNGHYQKIELCADTESSDNSVYGNEVDIYSSPLTYDSKCSQIMVEHVVDFGWEEKYCYGRLICFHVSGKYLAYVLKPANNKPGYIRVLRINKDIRCLIRGDNHEVEDISFAHSTSQVLLGSVDACGELLVHRITEEDETSLTCNLLIRICRPSSWLPSPHNHIIWCLYIPDENDDESVELEKTSLLVTTHDEKVEIWNIHNVMENHGYGAITFDEATVGVQPITEFEKPITHATFSPDGSALAIGSLDGVVKFFQVNTLDKNVSPRCLHHWTPHGDKPLSSLYFLDNYKNYRTDFSVQFWKFAVTGADNNKELKLWSCETWVCLQTLRIHPNVNDCVQPCLKAEMDLTSKYLFLSDIKRKVLLILLVQQDLLSCTAFIKSVSEFRVPLPVLSLAILSVSFIKYPIASGGENSEDDEDEEVEQIGNDGNRNKLIIRLFWIQTKTLQSCRITYKPKLESPLHSIGSVSSLSQDSYGFKDGLSDISLDAKESSSHNTRDIDISLQKGLGSVCMDQLGVSSQSSASNLTSLASHMNYSNCTELLLTPDDFTSPSHSNLSAQSSFTHHEEVKNPVSKCDSATRLSDGIDSLPVEPSTLQRRKSSQHSATSSPSREVAEIMAPTKGLHLDEIVLETPNLKVKDDVENLSNTLSSFATPISTRSQPDYHMKEWPQAPDPTKEYQISSRNEKNDIKNHNKCFLSNNEIRPGVQSSTESNQILYQLNQKFDQMLTRMDALTDRLDNQRHDIQTLQSEIKTLQDQKQNQVNTNLSNKLDQVVSQHIIPGYSRIESLILKSSEEEQRQTERELIAISNDLFASFGSRLDGTLKQELASCILPQINRVLDTVAEKMQLDFSQKLGATDANVREMFNNHLKGKAFIESMAQSISSSLQGVVHSACKEVFQLSVVPAYEKSCQQLFHQLNELFQKGTLDYIQILEKKGLTSCTVLETTASQVKEEIHNLSTSTKQAIHNHLMQRETFFTNVRQIIQEEVRKALKSQTSVLNSRSQTPVSHNDPMLQKQLLLQLVKQGSIDDAFQQALSAMDVQLVIFLCESVSVDQVFGTTPCPLQQHVLLSLVNQLSADLSVKTDIKVKYIEDVIACLDGNDPIIKEHIRNVLENLQQRIMNFLQKNPNHKYTRNLKRISLAIQSLIQC